MTRAMEKKIDELKVYLEQRLTSQEVNLKELCNNLVEKLKTELKNELKIQTEKINQLESDKSLLQQQVFELKKQNIKNQVATEENEQYGRRLCLRIDGMPTETKETSDMVLDKVTKIWKEAGVEIPNEVVDRAHRIGQSYNDKISNTECKSVIVRFTTFRHRTMVYRAKKKMKCGIRVKLDLTKSRYSLLAKANDIVKSNARVKFCYADINCRLKLKWVDDSLKDEFFTTIDELQDILGNC